MICSGNMSSAPKIDEGTGRLEPRNIRQSTPKAPAAEAQLDTAVKMEDDDADPSKVKLPLHEDIMQLARLGEIGPIQTLIEEGKFTADYKDAEDITPLHVRSCNGI